MSALATLPCIALQLQILQLETVSAKMKPTSTLAVTMAEIVVGGMLILNFVPSVLVIVKVQLWWQISKPNF